MGDPSNGVLDFGLNNFTLLAWVNVNNCHPESGNDDCMIISKTNFYNGYNAVGPGYYLGRYNDPYWKFMISDSLQSGNVVFSNNNPSGWFMISGVSQNSSIKIYINGEFKNSSVRTVGSLDNSNIFVIGSRSDLGWAFFGGFIDEVRIYNRALSDAEIKAIYNATK